MGFPTKLPKQYRAFAIEATRRVRTAVTASGGAADAAGGDGVVDGDDFVYDIVLSTETPIEQPWGKETLSHKSSAVDMSYAKNGLSLLLEHGKSSNQPAYAPSGAVDPEMHIGVIEDVKLDGGKLRGAMRFSQSARAQAIRQDVEDGIRKLISVGYIPRAQKQTKAAKSIDESSEYLMTRWTPVEASIVSIPADANAGVGRSAGGEEFPVDNEGSTPNPEEPMIPETIPAAAEAATPVATVATPAGGGVETRTLGGGGGDNRKQYADIVTLCESHGVSGRAADFISRGLSVDQVGLEILTSKRSVQAGAPPAMETLDGMTADDRDRYSYRRAILVAAGIEQGGLEKSVSDALAKDMPSSYRSRGGVMIPARVNNHIRTRALDSKTLSKGAEAIFDQRGDLIELLRNKARLFALGARLLTGLTQPVAFPKQSGAISAFWVPENPLTGVASSDPALGLVILNPKTLQASTSYSRQFATQASIDAESFIRNDLGAVHSLAIDKSGFHGAGVNGEPMGIYKAPNVSVIAMGGTPTFGKLTDMQTAVANQNALADALGYITTPTMAGKLKQTLAFAAAGSDTIWDGTFEDGIVAGYRATSTNQLSATMTGSEATGGSENGLIYGNWADLMVGLFGAMEIIVDPYTLATSGLIKLTSFQMADLILRHPESFCKATGAV